MMGMIIMMVIWLLSKVHQKTKTVTQDKKNKLKSIKQSLEIVYEAVKKHIETNDPKILALPDYGLILGTTQLLIEEMLIKEAIAEGKAIVVQSPPLPQEKPVEKEFNKPEGISKKVTFH